MSKRSELLGQETEYQNALKSLGKNKPQQLTHGLQNSTYGQFGFVTFYPEIDRTEIAVGDGNVYLDGNDGYLLLDALKAIYE